VIVPVSCTAPLWWADRAQVFDQQVSDRQIESSSVWTGLAPVQASEDSSVSPSSPFALLTGSPPKKGGLINKTEGFHPSVF
jgi:hypothetical protein